MSRSPAGDLVICAILLVLQPDVCVEVRRAVLQWWRFQGNDCRASGMEDIVHAICPTVRKAVMRGCAGTTGQLILVGGNASGASDVGPCTWHVGEKPPLPHPVLPVHLVFWILAPADFWYGILRLQRPADF